MKLCLLFLFLLIGCEGNMQDQPRHEPMEESEFFSDRRSARPLVSNTIPRGWLREDELLYTGMENGKASGRLPYPLTAQMLKRGRERYDIFCSACHDRTGNGQGMIVQRGFPPPPSFHDPKMRVAPIGHFVDVITRGYGRMYPYASRVPAEDRWAIAAYIRALQLSQNARPQDAPEFDEK